MGYKIRSYVSGKEQLFVVDRENMHVASWDGLY